MSSRNTPLIIGITGRSRSGKSTFAKELQKRINDRSVLHIDMDEFFLRAAEFNCDNQTEQETNAIDELYKGLNKLKSGKPVSFPEFDCSNKKYSNQPVEYRPENIIIIEGILVLFEKKIRDLLNLKVFIDTPNEICKDRRFKKKGDENGRWDNIISPQWERYLDKTREHADIVVSDTDEGIRVVLARLSTSNE